MNRLLLPVIAGAVATAPSAWWAVGVFTPSTDIADPDYLIEPLDLSSSTSLLIGGAGTAVAIAGALVVTWSIRSGRRPMRWLGIVGPLFVAFGYAGVTYRVATAPVIGANIGGGL